MNIRTAATLATRLSFLLLCGLFAWHVFDGRWDELGPALARVTWWRIASSCVLTLSGLIVTSWVWRTVLSGYGADVPWHRAAGVFFVGQIGKYIPGSVWSIGVQARLARSTGAAPRSVVGTGLLFLVLHVASGMLLGGVALALTGSSPYSRPVTLGAACAAALVGALMFHPSVLVRLSRWLTGMRGSATVTRGDSVRYGIAMLLVWSLYTAAVLVLVDQPTAPDVALLLAAVALSYVVGVVVVIAPAGLGAREAAFVALLSPSLGLTEATALALMARLVHTGCDFLLALIGSRSLPRR